MKHKGRWLISSFLASLVILLYLSAQKNTKIDTKKDRIKFGKINVYTKEGIIKFTAYVQKNKGWVQHLICLDGYKWLKEEAGIVSSAKLLNLQQAIAFLDWQLWDKLWYKKLSKKTKKLEIFLAWNNKKIAAQQVVQAEDNLTIEDLIFFGSPYFDHIVLETSKQKDCRLCPMFPLEKKALKEQFIRKSGLSGYKIKPDILPPKGTKITVIIKYNKN